MKYKQAIFGFGWAIFQPLLTVIVFTFIFSKIAGISSGDIPYPMFALSGLIFWQLFSNSVNRSSGSLVSNQNIVQKIYFPRIIMPISASLVTLMDFSLTWLVLIGLMVYYQFPVTFLGVLSIIPLTVVTLVIANGMGFFLSALNVRYRDVGHFLPFLLQLMFFLSPVIYPVTIVAEQYRWLLSLNPMTGVIETVRALVLGSGEANPQFIVASSLIGILISALGYIYFKLNERAFSDIL